MNSLKDKVTIITGASRGIGKAIAEIFEGEGARLVLTARGNLEVLSCFKNAKIVRLDLSENRSIDSLVEGTVNELGKIDILINNAGIFKQSDFELITEEELDEILNIDFKGPFLLIQKVFSQMKKQKSGKIVSVVSGAGKMGSSKAAHYAAAKSALISLTKSLAKLAGKYNINVNAVAPGFIETDMIKEMLQKKREFIESIIPLKRIGSALDVARVVLFLASQRADYITGQTISVDGGHYMV